LYDLRQSIWEKLDLNPMMRLLQKVCFLEGHWSGIFTFIEDKQLRPQV